MKLSVERFSPHVCEKIEASVHSCGTPTRFIRGIPHFDNDVINFIATLFGAMLGMALHLGIQFNKKDTRT